MSTDPRAGKPATDDMLVNIPKLMAEYFTHHPNPSDAEQRVSFGTSGHRGTAGNGSFNEDHILAVSQAVAEYRADQGTTGPLYLGSDTHALSEAARVSAVEVLAANGVELRLQKGMGYTPTPAVSHSILNWNRANPGNLSDGVVITPSHNPPEDGGFKYNPPSGGPADTTATQAIQDRANQILDGGLKDLKRMTYAKALAADTTQLHDYIGTYVSELDQVVNLQAIKDAGLHIGVDPMGGAGIEYWAPIAERYGLNLDVVNKHVDPTFSFMTVDGDGKIRMDCSSPYAMASLIGLRDQYDIAFGNDPDFDRHGIVTKSSGLLNPNHYLAVAIHYLFQNRPGWPADAVIGKTLVSSSMIDRVGAAIGRTVCEVPVGFKYFVEGLLTGALGFGGEESAGASFLRLDGTPWSTDKDGIIMNLLAAEILAVTGKDPGEHYQDLVSQFGDPKYNRINAPASSSEKAILKALTPDKVASETLAGDSITARLTAAPGNGEAIGGLKVTTDQGWFAARPSGTEDIYKIYAESFKDEGHLNTILAEAKDIVSAALKA